VTSLPGAGPSPGFPVPSGRVLVPGAIALVLVGGIASGIDPRYGLALVAALGVAVVVAEKPWPSVLLLATLAPITSGLARGFPIPGLKVSEVATVIVAMTILLLPVEKASTRWRFFDWAALVWVIAHFVQPTAISRLGGQVPTMAEEGVLLGPLQFFLFYRVLRAVASTPERRSQVLRWVIWASLPVSALTILQGLVPPLSDFLHQITGYTQEPWNAGRVARATSVFPHFQVLGAYLFAVVVLIVATAQQGDAVIKRVYAIPLAGLAGLALLYTLTITSIFGAIVALIAIGRWTERPLRHAGFIVGALVFLAILLAPQIAQRVTEQSSVTQGTQGSDRPAYVPQSVAFRYEVWTQQSIPALSGNWLTGVGASVPDSSAWQSTESMYVTLLFRGGILLLAVWALLWYGFWDLAVPWTRSRDPAVAASARFLAVVIPILALMCLIQPYFTYGGSTHLLWLAAALVLSQHRDRG
jgi:hypothetical protein